VPDWIDFVKSRLGALGLDPAREAEIVSELAQHLEDTYEELCGQGLSDVEAAERAPLNVSDWRALRCDISLALEGEDQMNQRTKSLWIPGLATLAASSLWLWGVQLTGFQPYFFFGDSVSAAYWPWLVVLPAIGALGAWWSRRAGGKRWERLLAAGVPVASMIGVMVLAFAVALAVEGTRVTSRVVHLGGCFWAWGILPGLALSVGALPFLRNAPGAPKVSGSPLGVERESSPPDQKPAGLFCWSS
jgi:hypothetical protein